MVTLSRREEEKKIRRLEILNAAKSIFDKKGFIEATIEEIAIKSRLSVGSIYNFFKNKESLYQHILKKILSDYILEIENVALKQKELKTAIKKIIEIRLKHFKKNKGFFGAFFELVLEGAFAKNDILKNTCIDFKETYMKKLIDFFQKHNKDLKDITPIYAALTLEGTLHAITSYKSLNEKEKNEKENSTTNAINNVYKIFKNLIR